LENPQEELLKAKLVREIRAIIKRRKLTAEGYGRPSGPQASRCARMPALPLQPKNCAPRSSSLRHDGSATFPQHLAK
jgi:hypothetical protein